MNWLFYVILGFILISIFVGARKGFFKMAISMVFLILVLILASLLNPYVAKFLREKTSVYETINEKSKAVVMSYLEKDELSQDDMAEADISSAMQNSILESLPLPQTFKNNLMSNNKTDIYELLGVNKFVDYLASYVAYSVTNGIAFLLSFALAIILIRVIMYAINILTSLPGIGFINSVGGMVLGGAQAILWIWVFFVVVTVLYNTTFGETLMSAIEGDAFLSFLYDKNVFLPVVMRVFGSK